MLRRTRIWRLIIGPALMLALAASPAAARAAGRCGNQPWCNTSLGPDQRAALLLGTLTETEKISLLGGDDLSGVCDCYANSHTGESDGIARVGLPNLYLTDGPVGIRQGSSTAMPVPISLASSFDPSLAYDYGALLGNEAKLKGNDVLYGPTINILRTPLWGRAFEGFGEDPFLTSRITVPWIEGAQSQGVIADVKHYAVYNQEGYSGPLADSVKPGQLLGPPAIEGNRMLVNVNVSQRAMREIYLPAFAAAVKDAHVGSVMCSYPRINGAFACENGELLNRILKREWGFKGFVLADYGAVHDTGPALTNGLDFEPWPGTTYAPLAVQVALLTGQATAAEVDDHVRRILRTLFAYGFFDRAAFPTDDGLIDKPAHAMTAQRVEEAGATLLENRGILPLSSRRVKSIAVIGSPAANFTTGGGSSAVKPFFATTPLQAITARAGSGVLIRYDDASSASQAVLDAKRSQVAIVFAADYETEGSDRYCLTLECPTLYGNQDSLIQRVAAANPNTIVVLETGGPVLTPWRNQIKGLLEAWYPGEEGGPAIARLLFGDANPSGHLPETWPARASDIPTAGDAQSYPGVAETVTYKEGILVGYRWYDARRIAPAFPFGYGLSYTSFRFARLSAQTTAAGATVHLTLTNSGHRAGAEVVQVYVRQPASTGEPPNQLQGFRKVWLAPRRTARVTISLPAQAFAHWDTARSGWVVTRGCYGVEVGDSSRNLPLRATLGRGGARCGVPRRPTARQ